MSVSTRAPLPDGMHAADFALKVYGESNRHLAGPMSIQEFLDTFLPEKASEESDPSRTGRGVLLGQIQQEAVDPFTTTVEKLRLKTLRLAKSSSSDDSICINGLKPDTKGSTPAPQALLPPSPPAICNGIHAGTAGKSPDANSLEEGSTSGSRLDHSTDRTIDITSGENRCHPSRFDCNKVMDHDINDWHVTQTDKFWTKPWNKGNRSKRVLQGYIHYRLVLDTFGRELTSFRSTKELLTAIRDAVEAHGVAYTKAGILHCDISSGNVLITSDGRGLLIDWELSRRSDQKDAHKFGRTGTWPFISAALLLKPLAKQNEYRDDLESFLHTVSYVLLRYSETIANQWLLKDHVERIYDYVRLETHEGIHVTVGGKSKRNDILLDTYILEDLQFVGRELLADGLSSIASLFHAVYQGPTSTIPQEELQKRIESLNTYEYGGRCVWQKLQDLIDLSGRWSDAPAKRVVFPETREESYARRRSECNRATSHKSTSVTCISVVRKHLDEGMFETELVIRKKRRLDSPAMVVLGSPGSSRDGSTFWFI